MFSFLSPMSSGGIRRQLVYLSGTQVVATAFRLMLKCALFDAFLPYV